MHAVVMGSPQVCRLNHCNSLPGQLFRRIAKRGQHCRIREADHALIIDHQYHIIGSFPKRTESFFTIKQRLLGNALGGNVAADASIAGKVAGLVENRLAADAAVTHIAALIVATNDEVAERLVSLNLLPMCSPLIVGLQD